MSFFGIFKILVSGGAGGGGVYSICISTSYIIGVITIAKIKLLLRILGMLLNDGLCAFLLFIIVCIVLFHCPILFFFFRSIVLIPVSQQKCIWYLGRAYLAEIRLPGANLPWSTS